MKNFWLLEMPNDQPLAQTQGTRYGGPVTCPNEDHQRAGKRIGHLSVVVPPLVLRDFMWTWQSDILISQMVLSLFKDKQVTGYVVNPVRVKYASGIEARPPDLFELVVTGWGGVAAGESGLKLSYHCRGCDHKVYSIAHPRHLVDPAAWDGSDLFIVWPLPRYRFISGRLARIIREERLSGVNVIPADQIRFKPGSSAIPGPLDYHMPDKRARELKNRHSI